MRSLLVGFAGVSPKSAVPNLVELFSVLIAKAPLESKGWIMDVLHGVRFCLFRHVHLYLCLLILYRRVISFSLVQVQKPRTPW
jgi:hypothetical protein